LDIKQHMILRLVEIYFMQNAVRKPENIRNTFSESTSKFLLKFAYRYREIL